MNLQKYLQTNKASYFWIYNSWIGKLVLIKNSQKELIGLYYYDCFKLKYLQPLEENKKVFLEIIKQLDLYFAGIPIKFKNINSKQGSVFQNKIYSALLKSEYAKTYSYKQLAQLIGSPKAYRAAGSACKNNNIAIIIACHRIIKADFKIGLYAHDNRLKLRLIQHEKMSLLLSFVKQLTKKKNQLIDYSEFLSLLQKENLNFKNYEELKMCLKNCDKFEKAYPLYLALKKKWTSFIFEKNRNRI